MTVIAKVKVRSGETEWEEELEVIQCPECLVLFAVNTLVIGDNPIVHCPICCMEVEYPEDYSLHPVLSVVTK